MAQIEVGLYHMKTKYTYYLCDIILFLFFW